MQIDFSPKAQFLSSKKDTLVKQLSTVVQSDAFHESLGVALAQWVTERNPEAMQIRGVKEFIGVLLDLPHETQKPQSLRTPQLDHTIYNRTPDPLSVHATKTT